MNQKIIEIVHTIIDPKTQKPLSELVEISGISEGEGFTKLQIQFEEISPEDKKVVRKLIEETFAKQGIEVLVNIIAKQQTPKVAPKPQVQEFIPASILAKFKKIVAVYSTKGGVGKSTISVRLALELADRNLKVAIVDLDIYGPSVPRILGVTEKTTFFEERFVPSEIHNIHMMSIGSLLPDVDSPLIWRAPVANGVIKQLFTDTLWDDDYDVLVIDMPPGTGDIPIAVGQSIPVDEIIMVSTPQGVALEDTVKGIVMFKKFNKNITGIVFNMSGVICPDCNKIIPLFPENKQFDPLLKQYGVEKIGELPLDARVSQLADEGKLNELEDSKWKDQFKEITDRVEKAIKD